MAIVAAGVDVRGLANIEELPNAPPQTHDAVSCSRIYLHKLEFFVAMPSIKREATSLATQPIDVDAPRAKRHKPAQPSVSATSQANDDQKQHTDASSVVQSASAKTEGAAAKEDPETVKERGLRLWQVIKDATNKEGRLLSHDFLRLPSKRQYPDYYEQIKRPVALDEIRRRLEHGQYAFFDEVKQDFEQCFKNAKKYNMKESQIWKDAKHLHKLVLLECEKLGAGEREAEADGGDGGSGSEAEAEEVGDKKSKKHNKTRLLKVRLQKLVQKTDDDGRVLSGEFMELPNKKLWPSYYKIIKHPRSFEMIFKSLKRREYPTVLDFANDVELIFSNALEFNQEHTQIWEDAIVLRDYFRHLMSTLPDPFAIPAYASADRSTKIKLKFSSSSTAQAPPAASTSQVVVSPKLYMPAIHVTPLAFVAHHPPASPARNAPQATSQTSSLPSAPAASTTQSQSSQVSPPVPPPPTFSPANFGNVPSTHYYSNTTYHHATASTMSHYTKLADRSSSSQALPSQPPSTQLPILTVAKSPTPPDDQLRRKLRRVTIITWPAGRRLSLDWKDGVKTWSVRLGREEVSVRVEGVRFMGVGEEGEESDGEGKENQGANTSGKGKDSVVEKHEEEEDEVEEEEEEPKPQQKRGRGRPRKKRSKVVDSPNAKGKGKDVAVLPPEDAQVKLNGMLIPSSSDEKESDSRVWDVQVPIGNSILEVGELEGMRWRVYLERLVRS